MSKGVHVMETPPSGWRDSGTAARKARLNQGLLSLASWAQSRATAEHNDDTTLTMLEKKVAEIKSAVNKAGWDAIAASHEMGH